MQRTDSRLALLFLAAVVASPVAKAELLQVSARGTVIQNNLFGEPIASVPLGATGVLTFLIDSTAIDDGAEPTSRAYAVDASTLSLDFGSAVVGTIETGPVFFALREEAGSDGFHLSTNPDWIGGFTGGIQTDVPGPQILFFRLTLADTTLSSLDVLDAVGTYDTTDLLGFSWAMENLFPGMRLDFEELSIVDLGRAFCMGVTCPCGNDDPAAGCFDSTGQGGALRSVVGSSTSLATDGFRLDAFHAPGNSGLLLLNSASDAPLPSFDGLNCVRGGPRALPGADIGGMQPFGDIDQVGLDGVRNLGSTAPGQGLFGLVDATFPGFFAAGGSYSAQFWFRDVLCGPPPAPCPSPCGINANFSNGWSFTVTP